MKKNGFIVMNTLHGALLLRLLARLLLHVLELLLGRVAQAAALVLG